MKLMKKIIRKLHKAFYKSKVKFFYNILSDNVPDKKPILSSPVLFLGKGKIELADGVTFGYFPSNLYYSSYSHIEARFPEAKITIGENTVINNNASIVAEREEISVGGGCLIGCNFNCISSDFHSLDPKHRGDSSFIKRGNVHIGNNVFIGTNVTVLKNVTIGDNCTVGNNSLVTKSFPDNVIIAGIPARIVGTVEVSTDE